MGSSNDPDIRRTQLDKVLSSRTFRAAQSQRKFILYAVEETLAGRAIGLKEFSIAVEALGREESFDPRLDPIVRTEARKLRLRLARYYETEGRSDPIRVEFPKGSYVPVFLPNRAEEASSELEDPRPAIAGTQPAEPPPAPQSPLPRLRSNSAAGVVAAVILAGCVAYGLRSGFPRDRIGTEARSIAVMPFVNLSGIEQNDILSDGMTQALIDSLAQIPDLQVVARASAFHFKGKQVSPQEIGKRLHVRMVLLGKIRNSGRSFQVTAQLKDAQDTYTLWSGAYEFGTDDISAVQREISTAVASVLAANLAHQPSHPRREYASKRAVNPSAYRNYLTGLYFWNKLTAADLKKAMRYFEQAIADDPSFARAYTALADCYVMAPQVATAPPPEVVSKIRALASTALELDASVGEAHFDLAICAQYEFDWSTAEKEFKKGLELSPGSAVGHLWYAKFLALRGRHHDVLTHRKFGAELDPVSPYAIQMPQAFSMSNILHQLCLDVGQVGNLRPIVNRPLGGGKQPPRKMPSCPTCFIAKALSAA